MCYVNDSDRTTFPPAFPAATAASFVIYPTNQPMQDTITWWNNYGHLPDAISTRKPSRVPVFDTACSKMSLSPIFQITTWPSGSKKTRTPNTQQPFVPPQDPYNTFLGMAGSDLRRYSISQPVKQRRTGQWNVSLR
jgi:hypothetical protein